MFGGCSKLNNVVIPNGTIIYESDDGYNLSLFENCTSLTNVTLPADLASIPAGMFRGCINLAGITLPPYIARIGAEAFRRSGLTSVVIPAGCVEIGSHAFTGCDMLTSVTIPTSVATFPSPSNGNALFQQTNASSGLTINNSLLPNLILTVAAGSAAETYAMANNIPLVYYTPAHVSVTDITGTPDAAMAAVDYALPKFTNWLGNDMAFAIQPAVLPSNASYKLIAWSVKDAGTTGASITNFYDYYLLRFTSADTAVLTATIASGAGVGADYTKDFTFTVSAPPAFVAVTDITGVPTTATAGTSLPLAATVTPADATNKTITWSIKTDSGTGASISGNIFTATAAGTATVTATIINGAGAGSTNYTKDFTITVSATSPVFVAVTGITGIPATATAGASLTFAGTVAPANATNQTITWSIKTAGTTGAAITSGNTFTATAAGSATITATIINGTGTGSTNYTKDFTITVNPSGGGGGGGTTPDPGTPGLLAGPAGVVVAAGSPARACMFPTRRGTPSPSSSRARCACSRASPANPARSTA
ncbi:MAG: leucine-rich repeat protein, partial [Opitutaceae bacterium]|nr:leucine-rich repeat protein [Opitutaceae bacterium]